MTIIDSGRDAPQPEPPVTINSAALDELSLSDLLALRKAIYDGWCWPDSAIPIMQPVWQAMIEAVERRILANPLNTLEDLCMVIMAFSNPREPWADGLLALRPHAEAVLTSLKVEKLN